MKKTLVFLTILTFCAICISAPVKSMTAARNTIAASYTREPILPPEYQEVEYLQSTNANQYIQVFSYVHINTVEFEMKVANMETGLYTYNFVVCASYGGQRKGGLDKQYPMKVRFWGKSNIVIDGFNVGSVCNLSFRDGIATAKMANGTTSSGEWDWNASQVMAEIDLWHSGRGLRSRIYHARFWQNKEQTHDLYPCVRVADNKPGFFNLITNEFLVNKGIGDFLVGPVKR